MARVLLIMPRLPQRLGAPYLGQQYIAAGLLAAGHRVHCLDLAALHWNGDDRDVLMHVRAIAPDLIGMTLFTNNALAGYRLAEKLQGMARLLVAGGPHPTVMPLEPLRFGFDLSIAGEGEQTIVTIARHLDLDCAPPRLPGIHAPTFHGPAAEPLEDLDGLAVPLISYPSYDSRWYHPDALVVPGGLMTSRGCPARCSFCANYVTGRAFRWRSAENVITEMVMLSRRYGVRHFPFWDDAFTARRSRLNALCDAIRAEPELNGITWSCITPGNMVKPQDLERMRAAGCIAINFGIESGDYNVLRSIHKGQRPEHVVTAVHAAKAAGMTTIVNFMFGFPGEGVAELNNTLALMKTLAPATDFFNNRGVLIPFPGTAIYDRWHEQYGFTEWWLDPARIVEEPVLQTMDYASMQRCLEHDPTLDLDFFHYPASVREAIVACVRFKARHNQRTIEQQQQTYAGVAD